MLRRVQIGNFRSCHEVVLDDLGPLTVLVGRNAAGKSNILRAISWLAEKATASGPFVADTPNSKRAVGFQITLDKDTYDYAFEVEVHIRDPQPTLHTEIKETLNYRQGDSEQREIFSRQCEKIKFDDGTTLKIPAGMPCMHALVSVLSPDSEYVQLVRPLLENLHAIRYYPLAVPQESNLRYPIIRKSEYNEWLARHNDMGDLGNAVLMRILDMYLNHRDQLDELKHLLGTNGLGLIRDIYVREIEVPKDKDEDPWYYIVFQPNSMKHDGHFSLDDLSSGTQRLIGIIASLIYDHSALMLLEHPEDSIHRALLRKLIDLLNVYSDRSQLIIASHSAVVFNTVSPDAIRLVSMEDSGTKVRPLTKQEVRAAARYLEEEGTLSDFLETVDED